MFGASVTITSTECRNGTKRCAEALGKIEGPDININLQDDAPLTPSWFLSDFVVSLKQNPQFDAATPVLQCNSATLERLRKDRQQDRVGGTTAVFEVNRRALYFFKEVLPFGQVGVFHYVGVYAYRPAALVAYAHWPEGPLGRAEGLKQLRFLEQGEPILCVEVDAKGRHFWELNNPEDIERIKAVLWML